ncbi:hypothetical protein VCR31J2_2230034 [Vibrio coralliirubri]|uniref:Uncharacterized protein n=1 Tax=Vibrio coralliirubri TaxID=1516159 RepID=A0AA87C224_9VIBR|nr:hypothetical protein VCR31J2_2230034 [Vibrio coralliirubri]
MFTYLPIYLSTYLPIYLSTYQFASLFIFLIVCFIYLLKLFIGQKSGC